LRSGSAIGFNGRPLDASIAHINSKFAAKKPAVALANIATLKAGFFYGETTELLDHQYEVAQGEARPGHLPQDHRQRGHRHGHGGGRATGGQSSSSTAAIRSRPPATSCTTSRR